MNTPSKKLINKFISSLMVILFGTNMVLVPVSMAQVAYLPAAGAMVTMTPKFDPIEVKGIKFYPDNPFKFDFIVDTGDMDLTQDQIKEQGQKLAAYFLASLTTPEKEMWVNLSPYEKSRIIPPAFGDTEMGKELLSEDYILKQIMATALYPERQLGKEFWAKVYAQSAREFGTTNVSVNTYNKVWIVPNEAVVYENAQLNSVFVVKSSFKVMLEKDYLAANKHKAIEQLGMSEDSLRASTTSDAASTLSSKIIKQIVIPALENEVNEGKNFASLRQVYQSLILAAWYKNNLKNNVLTKGYVDRSKTLGVNTQDKQITEKIYQQYLKAYRKGVYNYIKEEVDPTTNEIIPRKYFSGGLSIAGNLHVTLATDQQARTEAAMLSFSGIKRHLFGVIVGAGLLLALPVMGAQAATTVAVPSQGPLTALKQVFPKAGVGDLNRGLADGTLQFLNSNGQTDTRVFDYRHVPPGDSLLVNTVTANGATTGPGVDIHQLPNGRVAGTITMPAVPLEAASIPPAATPAAQTFSLSPTLYAIAPSGENRSISLQLNGQEPTATEQAQFENLVGKGGTVSASNQKGVNFLVKTFSQKQTDEYNGAVINIQRFNKANPTDPLVSHLAAFISKGVPQGLPAGTRIAAAAQTPVDAFIAQNGNFIALDKHMTDLGTYLQSMKDRQSTLDQTYINIRASELEAWVAALNKPFLSADQRIVTERNKIQDSLATLKAFSVVAVTPSSTVPAPAVVAGGVTSTSDQDRILEQIRHNAYFYKPKVVEEKLRSVQVVLNNSKSTWIDLRNADVDLNSAISLNLQKPEGGSSPTTEALEVRVKRTLSVLDARMKQQQAAETDRFNRVQAMQKAVEEARMAALNRATNAKIPVFLHNNQVVRGYYFQIDGAGNLKKDINGHYLADYSIAVRAGEVNIHGTPFKYMGQAASGNPVYQMVDKASISTNPEYGGIDLEKIILNSKGSGVRTAFSDPRILKMLLLAKGLFPKVQSVEPVTVPMVDMLLGFNGNDVPANDNTPADSQPKQSANQPVFLKAAFIDSRNKGSMYS